MFCSRPAQLWSITILLCLTATARSQQARATAAAAAPNHLTAEQDQQRLMNLLHIGALRQGADGNDPKAPNAANYDESKATTYPSLPDPLVLNDGKPVTTAAMWWNQRRPEIVELFDREIYGRMPAHTPSVKWEILSTTRESNGDVRCDHQKTGRPCRSCKRSGDHGRDPGHAHDARQRQGTGSRDPRAGVRSGGDGRVSQALPQLQTPAAGWPNLAAATARQGMGLCGLLSDQRSTGQWCGSYRGNHRPDEPRQAENTGTMGSPASLGLGSKPDSRLPGDRFCGRRSPGGDYWSFALWEGSAGYDGLRSAFRDRLHQLFGRRRRQDSAAKLGRTGGECRAPRGSTTGWPAIS